MPIPRSEPLDVGETPGNSPAPGTANDWLENTQTIEKSTEQALSDEALIGLNAPLIGSSPGAAYTLPERLPQIDAAPSLPPADSLTVELPAFQDRTITHPPQVALLPCTKSIAESYASDPSPQADRLRESLVDKNDIAYQIPRDDPTEPLTSDYTLPPDEFAEQSPNLSLQDIPLDPPLPSSRSEPGSTLGESSPSGRNPAMNAVADQAGRFVKHGFSLAQRGAYYSARSQFIRSLRTLSQALDAQNQSDQHAEALANGLRALEEAHDFMPQGSRLEADLDMRRLIAAHRTTALKQEDFDQLSALDAQRRYYTYAQEQLGKSVAGEPIGSMALYGLARVQSTLADQAPSERISANLRSMSLHQAALIAHPQNHLAANELGVLLARYQQHDQSINFLQYSARLSPQSETYHNLAVIHGQLGQATLAQQARQEEHRLAQVHSEHNQQTSSGSSVVWMTPDRFAQTIDVQGIGRRAVASPAPDQDLPSQGVSTHVPSQNTASKKENLFGWLKWKPSRK